MAAARISMRELCGQKHVVKGMTYVAGEKMELPKLSASVHVPIETPEPVMLAACSFVDFHFLTACMCETRRYQGGNA